MFTWGHFFIGLVGIGLGVAMVKFSYQVAGFTGRLDWIESKLGSGSTYFFYKMFGLIMIFVGLLLATGLYGPFMTGLFAPLRGFFGGSA